VNARGQTSRETVLRGLAEWDPVASRRSFLTLCLLPALTVLLLAMVYPLVYNVILSLSDANIYRIRDWRIAGFQQYLLVFRDPDFWVIFSKTVVWTIVCTLLQLVIGVSLAMLLYQRFVRGQSAWRLLLLLPWAMPQYITALTWRGMFQGENRNRELVSRPGLRSPAGRLAHFAVRSIRRGDSGQCVDGFPIHDGGRVGRFAQHPGKRL